MAKGMRGQRRASRAFIFCNYVFLFYLTLVLSAFKKIFLDFYKVVCHMKFRIINLICTTVDGGILKVIACMLFDVYYSI